MGQDGYSDDRFSVEDVRATIQRDPAAALNILDEGLVNADADPEEVLRLREEATRTYAEWQAAGRRGSDRAERAQEIRRRYREERGARRPQERQA